MYRIPKSFLLLFALALLPAAEPSWKSKPIQQWNEADAKQVLGNSPWVKHAMPGLIPQQTEAQRREGGQMGGGQGVGVGIFGSANSYPGRGKAVPLEKLTVRWESAFPVRAAELKAQELAAPDWDGDFYAIAVYDVPGLKSGDRNLASDLKRAALLKRDGKKDLKPERVDILPQASGLTTVVYFFPRSDEITRDDKQIKLTAQIARLYVEQVFDTEEMVFQGKLQL